MGYEEEHVFEAAQETEQEDGDRRAWIVIGLLTGILFACLCVLALLLSYFLFFAEASPPQLEPYVLTPVPVEQIQNVTWQWVELIETEPASQSSVPDPSLYTLAFGSDMQFTYRADCNVGSGAYGVDGANLILQMGPVTTAECGPESASSEYIGLLGSIASYGLDGGRLVLGLEDAVGQMIFVNGGPAQRSAGGGPGGETPATVPPPTPTMGILPLPVPVFPPEAAVGEEVAFDGSRSQPGSSPIVSYQWEFGDGSSGTGPAVTHPYGTPGVYAVTLAVMAEDGLSSSATGQIAINDAVGPQPTPEPPPTMGPDVGLVGPTWRWSEWISEGQPTAIPDPGGYTVRFGADLGLQIQADCNSASGTYSVQDNELLLDLGEISNNDCGPESLSAQYLELLSLVEEYELDEGNLLLYPIEIADRMVFVP